VELEQEQQQQQHHMRAAAWERFGLWEPEVRMPQPGSLSGRAIKQGASSCLQSTPSPRFPSSVACNLC
jgi:hypothetical protein